MRRGGGEAGDGREHVIVTPEASQHTMQEEKGMKPTTKKWLSGIAVLGLNVSIALDEDCFHVSSAPCGFLGLIN